MNWKSGLLVLGVVFSIPSAALAGVVTVSCDPGTTVQVCYRHPDTGLVWQRVTDTNNDGKVEVVVPRQDDVTFGPFVCKTSDGRRIWYHQRIDPGTFASLERFDLPSFAAVDPELALVAVVNTNAFLNAGNPFTLGQETTATNGVVGETSDITFKDGTGLPDSFEDVANQLSTEAAIDDLPDFSGVIEVMPSDVYAAIVPTVSEWGLMVMTLLVLTAGTVVVGWRRRAAAA